MARQMGRITYTTTMASVSRSPYKQAQIYTAATLPYVDTIPAGNTQDIYLDWGYASLRPADSDHASHQRASSGVFEVLYFAKQQRQQFTIPLVLKDRTPGIVNDYAILNAMIDESVRGTVLRWYPDWNNHPTEYYSALILKRKLPSRVGTTESWNFDFEFNILSSVQMPSTVPPFV